MAEDESKVIRSIGEKPFRPLVSLAAIVALVAANYFVFRLFDRNYFRWYLDHGAALALALSLVALAVDLDRDPTVVSADPGKYLAGWLALVGGTFLYLAGVVRDDAVGARDGIFTGLYGLAFIAVAYCWIAVVAPLQYFITLVTGAPARAALSARRLWVMRTGDVISLSSGLADEPSEGAEEVGLAGRPVTVTTSITASVLFVVSQLT